MYSGFFSLTPNLETNAKVLISVLIQTADGGPLDFSRPYIASNEGMFAIVEFCVSHFWKGINKDLQAFYIGSNWC